MSCWEWLNICKLIELDPPEEQYSRAGDSSSARTTTSFSSKSSKKSSIKQVRFGSETIRRLENPMASMETLHVQNSMQSLALEDQSEFYSDQQSPQPGPSRLMYQAPRRRSQPHEQVLSQLLSCMNENADSKLEHYKLFMEEVLRTPQRLTNTQFKKLHERRKSHLLTTFSNDYQCHPSLINAANKCCLKLASDINFHYHLFLKKHQEKTKKLGLKSLQVEAENFYDIDMENFRPWQKSRAQVKSKQIDAVKGALEHFDNLVRLEQGLLVDDQDQGIFRSSLKQKLDAKLQELLKTCLTFNIGIYIDEEQVIVGTIDIDNGKQIEVLQQVPAGIFFSQDSVKISETDRHWNYFSVHELIRTPKSSLTVSFETHKFTLLPEEILAVFFEKLIGQMQSVDNVVVTVSFALKSSEKKRIKLAAKLASMPEVKIVSSIVASAVAYAVECDYYCDEQAGPKLAIVSQYLRQSFSMASVEINTDFIATAVCTGSENFKECQNMNFLTSHADMYSNKYVGPELANHISKTYALASDYILNRRLNNSKVDVFIGIKDSNDKSKLDKVLSDIFDNSVTFRSIHEGPLAGACFLASKATSISLLPADVQVYDASRADFIVSVDSMKKRIDFRNRVYVPELPAFQISIPVPVEGAKVVVMEEFSHGHEFQAGRWKVLARVPASVGVPLITLRGLVDQDGVISIDAAFPQGTEGGRVFRLGANDGNRSDFKDMRMYYESFGARLRYPITSLGSSRISSSMGATPIQPSTPEDQEEPNSSELTSEVEERMMQVIIKEALLRYKDRMADVIDSGDALTDTEIEQYHRKHLEVVLNAVRLMNDGVPVKRIPRLEALIEEEINSQLSNYIRRKSTKIENSVLVQRRILPSEIPDFDEIETLSKRDQTGTKVETLMA